MAFLLPCLPKAKDLPRRNQSPSREGSCDHAQKAGIAQSKQKCKKIHQGNCCSSQVPRAEHATRKNRYRNTASHWDETLSSQMQSCLWVTATATHRADKLAPANIAARSSTKPYTNTPLAFQFSLFCLLNCLSRLNSWMWIKQTTWTFSQTGLLAVPLTNTMLSEYKPETQRKGNNCKGQEGNGSFAKGQHENTFLLWARALKSSQASPSLQATIFTPPSPPLQQPQVGLGRGVALFSSSCSTRCYFLS